MIQFHARTRAAHACPLLLGYALVCASCAQVEPLGDPAAVQGALESEHAHEQDTALTASAILRDAAGAEVGTIHFRPAADATWVSVQAHADAGGIRGLHIHANDNPENGEGCIADPAQPASTHFVSADGHFAPGSSAHGHHAGDMPALFLTEAGEGAMQFLSDRFTVSEILGRAVILHAGPDNYANIPVGDLPEQYTPNAPAASELTAKTGNAGARFACGVIERAED